MEYFTNMRLLRRKHNISLQELSRTVGVSHQYLSEIELSKDKPTEQLKAMIRKAFESVIAERRNQADTLAEDYVTYRDSLFDLTTWEREERP